MSAILRTVQPPLSPQSLGIDAAAEVGRITSNLREQVHFDLRRRGLVLGLSGGIDSSVSAALAVRALGSNAVFALLMPENDSDPESLAHRQLHVGQAGRSRRRHLLVSGRRAVAGNCRLPSADRGGRRMLPH